MDGSRSKQTTLLIVVAVGIVVVIIAYNWGDKKSGIDGELHHLYKESYDSKEGYSAPYMRPSTIGAVTSRRYFPSMWKNYPPYWWQGNFYSYYPPAYSYMFGQETQNNMCRLKCTQDYQQCGTSDRCQIFLDKCLDTC